MTINIRKGFFVYLLLLVFLLIAYFPLSSFLFALKNDALTANFPNKYFFSAALHDGYFPVWNPYINFGFPLYADPGFAFWNPITWLFGWLGYSVPMLSVEILFYIWIGGVGAYELGRWLGHARRVSFCMGIMYMCCGFFIGNLQHINFLTCAAFLPLVLKTYLALQQDFNIKNLFYCLICLFLLATGGHPAIPVATLYFLVLIQLGMILFSDTGENKMQLSLRSLKSCLILTGCFIVLAGPLLYSYFEVYPHFTRAAPVIQSNYSDTGFDMDSYLSFLYPFSTTGNNEWLKDDPLMRNGYFSMAGLFCLLTIFWKKKDNNQKVFLLAGTSLLLLSLGGPVKELLYSYLPLLDHIRTNGEFRVFGILAFILAGSYSLSDLIENKEVLNFKKGMLIIAGICVIIILTRFIFNLPSTLFLNVSNGDHTPFFLNIKMRLDALTFYDRIFINAVISFLLIAVYFFLTVLIKGSTGLIIFIAIDLIVFSWMLLPVTGVQILSAAAIENYFNDVPPGIPIPRLEPVSENHGHGEKIRDVIGCWSYYSKQPGTPELCNYPSRLNSTVAYFNSSWPESINRRPFVFIRHKDFPNSVRIISFSPSQIKIQAVTEVMDSLVFLQNDYPGWKASVNGSPVNIDRAVITFMKVPIQKGLNEVIFYFDNRKLLVFSLISVSLWAIFSIFVFIRIVKIL